MVVPNVLGGVHARRRVCRELAYRRHHMAAAWCSMTDAQLKRYAVSFRSGILGRRKSNRMCFAVCAPLCPLLNMMGVACQLVENDLPQAHHLVNHVWLRLSDGRALDPTADQFPELGLPKIYLGPPIPHIHFGTPE